MSQQVTGMIVETLCGQVEGADVFKTAQAAENQENEMNIVVSKP